MSTFPGAHKEKKEIKKGPIIMGVVFIGLIVWMALSVRNTIKEPLTPAEKARIDPPVLPKVLLPRKDKTDDKPINVPDLVVNQIMHGETLKIEYGGSPPRKTNNQLLPGSRSTKPTAKSLKEVENSFYPDAKGGNYDVK